MTGLGERRIVPFGAEAPPAPVAVASSVPGEVAVRAPGGRTGEIRALRERPGDASGMRSPAGFGLLQSAGFAGPAAREAGAS